MELVVGDIADAAVVEQAGAGCDAVANFAAETHVDRSILGPQEFVHTDVLGTMTLLEWAAHGARYVQVSTDEVYGDLEAGGRATEGVSAAVEPVQRRGKAATCRCSPMCARTASTPRPHAVQHVGPNQYPEKLVPLFVTNALDGQLPVRRRKQVREWPCGGPLRGIDLVLREGAPERSTTSAARITRTSR